MLLASGLDHFTERICKKWQALGGYFLNVAGSDKMRPHFKQADATGPLVARREGALVTGGTHLAGTTEAQPHVGRFFDIKMVGQVGLESMTNRL